ncbi:hypothetical protein NX722_07670 [Endozoicomonas gorgoniicola]|uniref:Right-handed parallel beta-helix repeat-containing protein n=1 Tax=Endozoicomonas gorgoniicola TaxID=1234144 RepID=A0ABT3MT17_9GAMM|nr:hypothetical protein [Endozoicomonas gorgoniicola]MCW7552526.1 hypothetical protein [Endozoicomonas gorgoniicola]
MKQVINVLLKHYSFRVASWTRADQNQKITAKKHLGLKSCLALFLPALLLMHLYPGAGNAAPSHSSFNEPSQNISSTAAPATVASATTQPVTQPTTQNDVSRFCGGEVDYGGLNLNDTILASISSALEQYQKKHPADKISRCIIKTPDGHPVDEAILSFNEGKLQSAVYNTAFLLLGKGIRISDKNPAESCHLRPYRFAGDTTSQLSAVQDNWENSYQVTESITLAAGQKLIGIPLNINNDTLAEGFYVNLRRLISAKIRCKPDSEGLDDFLVEKNSLIRLSQPGVVVSGVTNALDINQKATFTGKCETYEPYRYFLKSYTRQKPSYMGYQNLIKAEIDPRSLSPDDAHLYDISDNELFQAQESAIHISFKQGSDTIDSNRMDNMTFVRISNNRLYSCHADIDGVSMARVEPVLNINTYYNDNAQNPGLVHALELTDNQLMTKGDTAVRFVATPNTSSVIKKNKLTTSAQSLSDSRGISLTGTNHLKDTARPRPEFTLEDNSITGFQDGLLLDGTLSLTLNSNRLTGKKSAIARAPGQLTDPIQLSGNQKNTYSGSVTSPCAGLDLSTIEGGFLFSDGTPCPASYSPDGDSPGDDSPGDDSPPGTSP